MHLRTTNRELYKHSAVLDRPHSTWHILSFSNRQNRKNIRIEHTFVLRQWNSDFLSFSNIAIVIISLFLSYSLSYSNQILVSSIYTRYTGLKSAHFIKYKRLTLSDGNSFHFWQRLNYVRASGKLVKSISVHFPKEEQTSNNHGF